MMHEEGGIHQEEFAIDSKGKEFPVQISASVVRNEQNEPIALMCSSLDITEQKQAESDLEKARNYISNIVDSMPSALIGVDSKGTVTQWNVAAQNQTGIKATDAIGQTLQNAIPRLAKEMEQIKKAIKSKQQQHDRRRAHYLNGELYFEDLTIYPLIANGVQGAVIRIDDITERVRIEEMMIQSEKMLSVGGLAAGMAHEINNPLGGMIQTAEVINYRLSDIHMEANIKTANQIGVSMETIYSYMDKREIFKMINSIRKSGQRAANIIENMLSFSRKSEESKYSYDLVKIIDKCVELNSVDYDLKKNMDFKKIKIVREYEDNLPKVPCDAGKIQQVIMNLLRNGTEAMISNQQKSPTFVFRIHQTIKSNKITFEIEDNGPGIPKKLQSRIFEPFFTTKSPGQGTGLGLSVSYYIITENHKGSMHMETTENVGTKFIIELPL